MRARFFGSLAIGMMVLLVLASCGILPTGSSITYDCTKADYTNVIAQSVCLGTSVLTVTGTTTTTTTVQSSCSYSEMRVYSTVNDLTTAVAETPPVSYTSLITSSSCTGIIAGSSSSNTSTGVSGDGAGNLTIAEFTSTFAISGLALSATIVPACLGVGQALESITVDAGSTLGGVSPTTTITLFLTYSFDPNGGC